MRKPNFNEDDERNAVIFPGLFILGVLMLFVTAFINCYTKANPAMVLSYVIFGILFLVGLVGGLITIADQEFNLSFLIEKEEDD